MRQRQCRIFLAFSLPDIFGALNKNTIWLFHYFVYLLSLFECRTHFFAAKFVEKIRFKGTQKNMSCLQAQENFLERTTILSMAFRSYVPSVALLEVTTKIFFIRDVYLGKIGERAETLPNIHRHMHFLLCILRDKKDIKKNWTLNSIRSTNRSRIVSQVRSAMWQISCSFFSFPRLFFLLEVLTRLFLDLFRLFVCLFVCDFLDFFPSLTLSLWSKLGCLPNSPPPPPIFPSSQSPTPGALSTPACVHRSMKPRQQVIYHI